MTQHRFELRGDFVELHALLKLLALAPRGETGGMAAFGAGDRRAFTRQPDRYLLE